MAAVNSKCWKVLCWNVRGVNSSEKWNPIRDTIVEAACDVFCFQETKRDSWDTLFLRKFSPSSFDSFEFHPTIGASGGLITCWKSSSFSGQLVFQNDFAITVKLTSKQNGSAWFLTNVYGPCTQEGRRNFLEWLESYSAHVDENWLLVGDFNLLRKPEDRNRPGGNINDMLDFNSALSSLGLVEIPLFGRKYTWTNKQSSPLLERLDWLFSSSSWTTSFPDTTAKTLVMQASDHWPCNITISTVIPRSSIFRFENTWLQQPSFNQTV